MSCKTRTMYPWQLLFYGKVQFLIELIVLLFQEALTLNDSRNSTQRVGLLASFTAASTPLKHLCMIYA